MLDKNDYEIIKSLSYGHLSTVFRAEEISTHLPRVLKRVPLDAKEKIKLQGNEFEVLKDISSERLEKCFGQILDEKENILVLEDFQGESLDKLGVYGKLSLKQNIDLFIDIALALKDLHENGYMHKDLNPANIVWNRERGILKLVDFDLSSKVKQEFVKFESVNRLIGTLNYISPEQTGRINRTVDFRTDFYSLGVTFYQILYGKLPFYSESPVELVYFHLTKEPLFPDREDVPKQLKNIMGILLAKKAEDRYQSVDGLIGDLKELKRRLEQKEPSDFPLKTKDFSSSFIIDETLYGRDRELEVLIQAYEHLDANTSQLAFISGEPGVGKTMLARELIQTIAKKDGIFISGKYQMFQKDMLGGAVTESLSSYFKLVISDSKQNLATWKDNLEQTLGINAKVLTDAIPELELIMGEQRAPAELGPMESQTRFILMLVDLFQLIGSYNRPLVIFLDDLQWGSEISFEILHSLLTSEKIGNVFFIAAYRDNEIGASHPAKKILDLERGARIQLKPLPFDMCLKILKDAFKQFSQVERLNSFVYSKTNGNPFSIKEFLRKLVADKFVYFNRELASWDCDFKKLNKAELTENIVVLLAEKIQSLDPSLQSLMGNASVLGTKFNLNFLASVLNQDLDQFKKNTVKAIELNLLINVDGESGEMRFCHDKVLEAAYSLLSEKERMKAHLRIGNKLLAENKKNVTGEAAARICLHLNKSFELMSERSHILRLAKLNQLAALHSRKASVFHMALNFSQMGIKLLNYLPEYAGEKWAKDLQVSHAEFLYLTGHYSECEAWVDQCLAESGSGDGDNIHSAWLLNQLAIQYTSQGRYADALAAGVKGLGFIGVELPSNRDAKAVEVELKKVNSLLKDTDYASLANQKEMEDPRYKLAMVLLINMDSPSYLSDINFYCIVVATMVQISIEKGPVPSSAKAYASYGIVLSARNEFQSAYRFTDLGIKIAERFKHLGQLCRACHTMANHVIYWSQHIKHSDAYNKRGEEAGIKAGEYLWVSFIKLFTCYNQFFRGRSLEGLREECQKGLEFCRKHPNQLGIDTLKGLNMVIDIFIGENSDEQKNHLEFIEDCKKNNSLMSLSCYLSARVFTLIMLEDYEKAQEEIEHSLKLSPYSYALVTNVFDTFSDSFLLIRRMESLSSLEKSRLRENMKQLKILSNSCPENFLHIYQICKAEEALKQGKVYRSIECYDRAVKRAAASGFNHIEALACQRLALIWKELGSRDVSLVYARKAHSLWQLFGAKRMADKVRNTYVLKKRPKRIEGSSLELNVDVYTILQAYQVMGEKLVCEDLVNAMLSLMKVNSGATKIGLFKLLEDGSIQLSHCIGEGACDQVPLFFLRYVLRSKESYIYQVDKDLPHEEFLSFSKSNQISLACIPLGSRCVIALVNDQYESMFSKEKLKLLKLLTKQLEYSLNNIEAYNRLEKFNEELEVKVKERTLELEKSKNDAELINEKLRSAQRKLVDAARQAGEADVKTNILHNLGNAFSVLLGKVEEFENFQIENDGSEMLKILINKLKSEERYQPIFEGSRQAQEVIEFLEKIYEFGKKNYENRIAEFSSLKDKTKLIVGMIHSQNTSFRGGLLENIDLEQLIQESIAICEMEGNCDVSVDLKNIRFIEIDYAKVKSILTNFVSNSLEACRGTGRRAQIFITALKEGEDLVLEVTDNGEGMDENTLKKVFDAGFSTKEFNKNASYRGYGLHNSANIAQQLGGKITASSKGVGMGSTLRLILPLDHT